MVQTCLFCSSKMDGDTAKRSLEHIVPASLGGWLTTDMVCRVCNSRLGHEVDRVADEPLLTYLRAEVGLPTRREIQGEYFDDDWGLSSRVTFQPHKDGFRKLIDRVITLPARILRLADGHLTLLLPPAHPYARHLAPPGPTWQLPLPFLDLVLSDAHF